MTLIIQGTKIADLHRVAEEWKDELLASQEQMGLFDGGEEEGFGGSSALAASVGGGAPEDVEDQDPEQILEEQLGDELYDKFINLHQRYLARDGVCEEDMLGRLECKVCFVTQWNGEGGLKAEATSVLQQMRNLAGNLIYVLNSNIPLTELRGISELLVQEAADEDAEDHGLPPKETEGDHDNGVGVAIGAPTPASSLIRSLPILRTAPVAVSPFDVNDANFPPENTSKWVHWALKRFQRATQKRAEWWESQVSFSSFANVPVCNFANGVKGLVLDESTKLLTLDLMFNRRVREAGLLTWASGRWRPDVGCPALAAEDAVEHDCNFVRRLVAKQDSYFQALSVGATATSAAVGGADTALLTSVLGEGGGSASSCAIGDTLNVGIDEIVEENYPGVYRSVCFTIRWQKLLTVVAIINAVAVGDEFNSEISLYRKAREEGKQEILEHPEECGIPAFEALIATIRDLLERSSKADELREDVAKELKTAIADVELSAALKILEKACREKRFGSEDLQQYDEFFAPGRDDHKEWKDRLAARRAAREKAGGAEVEGGLGGGGEGGRKETLLPPDDDEDIEMPDADELNELGMQLEEMGADWGPGTGGAAAAASSKGKNFLGGDNDDAELWEQVEIFDNSFAVTDENLDEIVDMCLSDARLLADLPVSVVQLMLRYQGHANDQTGLSSLTEFVYSWLSNPRAHMYDPALLKKVGVLIFCPQFG